MESPGKRTDSSEVMSFLETSLATIAVKAAFPTATYDKRKFQYRNVRKPISFGIGKDETASQDIEYLQVSQNTEISELQQNLLTHKQKAKVMMDDILSNSAVNVYLSLL